MNIDLIERRLPHALLLGFTGAAGSGKDSCAATLARYGFRSIAFADELRAEVAQAWRIDLRMLTDRDTKEWPIPALAIGNCGEGEFVRQMYGTGEDLTAPRSARWIMQRWGTEYRRAQDNDYWTTQVARWISRQRGSSVQRLCVTDVRFANEAHLVARLGGHVLRVHRPGLAGSLAGETARHVSEQSDAWSPADAPHEVVHNDGDLEHLHAELVRVILALGVCPADTRLRA